MGTFVSDCGSDITWLSLNKGCFPCLRPGNKYLLLQNGSAKVANGLECLAVQGIGPQEIEAFGIIDEEDKLQRCLAGNAFSANVLVVFLVASLLSL